MAHTRFLPLLMTVLTVCLAIDPALGLDLWNWDNSESTDSQQATAEENKWTFLGRNLLIDKQTIEQGLFNKQNLGQLRELAMYMALSGFAAIVAVKACVWFIGFGMRGVRKNTVAANLIKNKHGRVQPGSWLALMQSIGAGGLGFRRSIGIFLFGAVMAVVMNFYVVSVRRRGNVV